MLEINIGSIDKGKRSILNSERETNAVFESRTFFSSERTNVANDTNDTRNGAHDQMNVVDEYRYAAWRRTPNSLFRIFNTRFSNEGSQAKSFNT